jgi:phosphotransferase system enzyme I (PtsI)
MRLIGVPVSAGTAVGPAVRMAARPAVPAAYDVVDTTAEKAAVSAAFAAVVADLTARATAAAGTVADVLSAQAAMASDPSLMDAVADGIDAGADGPHAVQAAFGTFRTMFEEAGGLLAERVADLDDIRDRVIATLLGLALPGIPHPGHPFVLIATDLAPADTATLQPDDVLGLVTERGGPTSHTAILARTLGIPAVVSCAGAMTVSDGVYVSVDGSAGTVDIGVSPEPTVPGPRRPARTGTVRGATADGHPVKLMLNVGSAAVPALRGDGVGLFRTEFLFLSRQTAPSMAEQQTAYAEVFAAHPGQTIVVRTLDAGADKPLPFLALAEEPNPALGVRGFRTVRHRPEILDEQLQAIALAAKSTAADVWVMAPMITTAVEAADFARRARAFGRRTVGVMIEVPAAALHADRILAEVDFISIGTNDLSQYAMASDRMSGDLADLLDPWQPAVLSLVKMCAEAGRAAGKPVGVCGEAAADPLLATVLVGLGVTSLSMAGPALGGVADGLLGVGLADCIRAAEAALAARDPASARQAVRDTVAASPSY